mmetsp:Transcript_36669/g.91877  ORF Transcript_36669/g.91877 Transcript_36669/m.91877 type:complete len:91 (-) Transcript_36669:174-446(-)
MSGCQGQARAARPNTAIEKSPSQKCSMDKPDRQQNLPTKRRAASQPSSHRCLLYTREPPRAFSVCMAAVEFFTSCVAWPLAACGSLSLLE